MEDKCQGCSSPIATDTPRYCHRCNAYRDERLVFLQKEIDDLLIYIEKLEVKYGVVPTLKGECIT